MATTLKRVLLLDKVHPLFSERLPQMGFYLEEDYLSNAQDIDWPTYTGLVIRSRMPMDAEILKAATNLKFIARVGAGLENIDLDTAQELGIHVLAAPEGNRNAVGEQALGMLLALFNRLLIADSEVRKGLWLREENRGLELKGKTVGIIGYGNMGSAFAAKLRGMECRVIAYDKYKTGFGNEWLKELSLEELKAEADIISLHLPQNAETMWYVDSEFIETCTKDFFLINTARGKLVRSTALVSALETGKIRGACLDVLEFEKSSFENIYSEGSPPELEYLLQSDKVVLSPHIAGWTHESKQRMAEVLISKIEGLGI